MFARIVKDILLLCERYFVAQRKIFVAQLEIFSVGHLFAYRYVVSLRARIGSGRSAFPGGAQVGRSRKLSEKREKHKSTMKSSVAMKQATYDT